jgi:predicted AlkP superfamily pyrophosphatase or phosphodiesterase
MGDLILYAKDGYAFKDGTAGDAVIGESTNYLGTHGYLASDPELDGVMIAWGYGIRPGTHLDRISNTDIAPTLAELLGVSLPNTDGHALKEMLK